MTLTEALILFLRWFTLAGMIFTCARLWHFGLHRRYRVFFAYLVFSSVRSGILLIFDVSSSFYFKFWIVTEPVLWLFYILLVLELYSLVLEAHKGLYTVGRWALWGALSVAMASALVSLLPQSGTPYGPSWLVGFYVLVERGLLFSLVIFLILMLWFLSHYPVVLRRNVVIHSVVYAIFFLSSSVTFLAHSFLGYEVARPLNALFTAIMAICVVGWMTLLDGAGEVEKRSLKRAWNTAEDRRLIEQLDSLNATLLRIARK